MESGQAAPLGASVHTDGVNFAIASSVADAVELCVFDDNGRESRRIALPGRSSDVWHGFLPGAASGLRYGYRVHGRWQPASGLACNAA